MLLRQFLGPKFFPTLCKSVADTSVNKCADVLFAATEFEELEGSCYNVVGSMPPISIRWFLNGGTDISYRPR